MAHPGHDERRAVASDRRPRDVRGTQVVKAQVDHLNKVAAKIDGLLSSRAFVAGDQLSLADFTFAAFLFRYYTLEIDRPNLAKLQKYYERLCERPSYVEHVHVDYDGMRVAGAERP